MAALKAWQQLLRLIVRLCRLSISSCVRSLRVQCQQKSKRGFDLGITCSPSFWTGTPSAAESRVKVETERRERGGKTRVY